VLLKDYSSGTNARSAPQMTVVDCGGTRATGITFPEAVYTRLPSTNPEFDTPTLRYAVPVVRHASLGLRV